MITRKMNQGSSALRSPQLKQKEVSLYSELYSLADVALLDCFNSFAADCWGSTKSFAFHGKDVSRARRVVSTWHPQKYDAGQSKMDFDVPYVLSGFFDRYISFEESASSSKLQAKAARKFLGTNLDGIAIDQYVLNHDMMKPLLDRMKFHMNGFFNTEFNPLDLYHLTGHGPNRTTDVEFDSAYLHIKNRSISGPKASLQQLLHYLHWDFQLRDEILSKEDDALRSTINGWDLEGLSSHYGTAANVVEITDTGFVPKKFDSLRTMCPEPTAVAFFAKMVALWITSRLSTYCHIDLRTQPLVHKNLARLGSLFENLHIATVDWSEASDRIWLLLIEELMSEGYCPGWFSFMSNVCRCKSTNVKFKGTLGHEGDFSDLHQLEVFLSEHTDSFDIKLGKNGKSYAVTCTVQTTMFATMGNPLTFPLQTLVFWAFLEACTDICACENDLPRDELLYCSSFGDDGIVDSRVLGTVQKYATWLNWKLNLDKSFYEGGFRESCGGDYYCGRMVRPFEPKAPPLDKYITDKDNKLRFQAWLYILYNNISDILQRLDRSPFHLEQWLLKYHSLARVGKVCLVPPDYPDGSGVRSVNVFTQAIPYFTSASYSSQEWAACRAWDSGPCITSQDERIWPQYHFPWYTRDGSISFRCLSSIPRPYGLDDLDVGHYYHDTIKCFGRDVEWHPHLSFFDQGLKEVSRMRSDGDIAVKECRIRKTQGTVYHW